jgi:large subunit ribosomal protein L7/L12
MSTAEATTNFDDATKTLGDKIVSLTLLQAKSLADYLEQVHGIKPASGGVMMAGPVAEAAAACRRKPNSTSFCRRTARTRSA